MEKMRLSSQPEDPSRRKFLKDITKLAVGTLATNILGSCNEETDRSQDKYNLASIKEVLESDDLEKFLKNEYIVYALFYSKNALDIMALKDEAQRTPQEKNILEICEMTTPNIRKKYIDMLDEALEEKNLSAKTSRPLKKIEMGDIKKNHKDALDLFIEEGSPVYTVRSGIVVLAESGWRADNLSSTSSQKGGNAVIVYDTKRRQFYRYAHLEDVKVKTGEIIQTDTVIGTVGHTGINASKPGHGRHLHFEINTFDENQNIMIEMEAKKLKAFLENIRE